MITREKSARPGTAFEAMPAPVAPRHASHLFPPCEGGARGGGRELARPRAARGSFARSDRPTGLVERRGGQPGTAKAAGCASTRIKLDRAAHPPESRRSQERETTTLRWHETGNETADCPRSARECRPCARSPCSRPARAVTQDTRRRLPTAARMVLSDQWLNRNSLELSNAQNRSWAPA